MSKNTMRDAWERQRKEKERLDKIRGVKAAVQTPAANSASNVKPGTESSNKAMNKQDPQQ